MQKKLRVPESALKSWSVEKRSVDARKKPSLYYVYTVVASLEQEKKILKSLEGLEYSFRIETER